MKIYVNLQGLHWVTRLVKSCVLQRVCLSQWWQKPESLSHHAEALLQQLMPMQVETSEKTPQPKVLWIFWPKTKSLTLMHHFIPFNFISGHQLQIPDHVWSLGFPSGQPTQGSSYMPRAHALQIVIAECVIPLYSLLRSFLHHCHVLLNGCLVLPQKEWVTRILRLKSIVLSVLLGANTDQSSAWISLVLWLLQHPGYDL